MMGKYTSQYILLKCIGKAFISSHSPIWIPGSFWRVSGDMLKRTPGGIQTHGF
jgi:hypothetical protein